MPRPIQIEGYDDVTVARHVEMLIEAGLAKGSSRESGSSHTPVVKVTDLTWEGHEFASALQNKGVWNKIKQTFERPSWPGCH